MKNNNDFLRQIKFIAYYLDQGSYTYSNLRRAALKAGYSDSYARKIGSCLSWEEMADAISFVRSELDRFLKSHTKL